MRHRRDRARWLRLACVVARRWAGRVDRSTPTWAPWVPSWGTSLALHGAALVVLALWFFVASVPRDRREIEGRIVPMADSTIDSLTKADRAGDPFTTLQTDLAPSLPNDTARDLGINQPKAVGVTFGPELASNSREVRRTELSDSQLSRSVRTTQAGESSAPFSGRSAENRAMLVRREGGTAESEQAVQDGLNWLARHQADNGGWHLNVQQECQKDPGCPDDSRAVSDTAATGLALLPFLGAGHIHTQPGPFQETVGKGIDWIIEHQQKTGELFLGGIENGQMYSHAIAAMALCESYGLSKDPKLKGPAQRAINFIIGAQNKLDGGWRYYPGSPGDTSVFGWEMFALRSAKLSGLDVPKSVIKGCNTYLDLVSTDSLKTRYSYMPGRPPTPSMTAEGLLCRQYLGWNRDTKGMAQGAAGVWDDLQASNERNIYYWYYATQLLHNMRNKAWRQWNVMVRDGLVAMQVKSQACDHGSWSPFEPVVDRWGRTGGRLFQTSMSILTLEVYYRFLPLYRDEDDPIPAGTPVMPRSAGASARR